MSLEREYYVSDWKALVIYGENRTELRNSSNRLVPLDSYINETE